MHTAGAARCMHTPSTFASAAGARSPDNAQALRTISEPLKSHIPDLSVSSGALKIFFRFFPMPEELYREPLAYNPTQKAQAQRKGKPDQQDHAHSGIEGSRQNSCHNDTNR